MLDQATLEQLIEACGLAVLRPAILDLAQPSIRLLTEPVRDVSDIPVGASRLGGPPDLPPGAEYPQHKGKRLDFVAQIDLADIAWLDASGVLPASGLIQFFHGVDFSPEARASGDIYPWAVVLRDSAPAGLERSSLPPPNPYGHFKPCRIDFRPELTLPPRDSAAAEHYLGAVFDSDSPLTAGYELLVSQIWDRDPRRIFNRMLGYANPVQGDVFREADAAVGGADLGEGVMPPRQNWMLLLQVDSDDYAEMMWGDVGMLYFCIRQEDLAARRFDRVVCIMQEN